MARRLKSTPFARFLIAMLFIVPAAYIGAAYYNNEDPIQSIKDKLGMEDKKTETTVSTDAASADETYDPQRKINELEQQIEEMKRQIEDLMRENNDLKKEMELLKQNQ